ncbi:hypothetical protein Phou_066940 [Phytohabitans houttuyneae]|uniref:Uncharacterized protein n=1 Tax=Phytohabitans houttuyneae TaxID=1076126 RepID=A0A6V8KFC2_9ACTN|nr:hypothetical protein Phou_066940 [Phytohabitans houttuyneae]
MSPATTAALPTSDCAGDTPATRSAGGRTSGSVTGACRTTGVGGNVRTRTGAGIPPRYEPDKIHRADENPRFRGTVRRCLWTRPARSSR